MPLTADPTLDYASRPAAPRRWRGRLILLILLVAGICAAFHYERPVRERITYRYWQWRCLSYTSPPDRITCGETESPAGALPAINFSAADPNCATALLGEWGKPVPSRAPLLFIHERQSAAGTRALVMIRRMPADRRASVDLPVAYWVTLAPPSPSPQAAALHEQFLIEVLPHPFNAASPNASITFFAGQPDPTDASRFTIAYQVNGRAGTLEGNLLGGSDKPLEITLEDQGLQ